MAKLSSLQAILSAKWPCCHVGDIYVYSNYKLDKFSTTNKICPHCNIMFECEPDSFFGAILLSTSFVLYFLFIDPPYRVYMITIPGITHLLFPLSFRYSGVIYLYTFGGIKYKGSF